MPNQHLLQRLTGFQSILNGVHQSSSVGLSSATVGQERAAFVDEFLSKVLPPIYRFGTGDATDSQGARSGQLDVVVECPFAPSLPVVGAGQTRLYLAEGIAAVIEVVKSNLTGQWEEAVGTASLLAALERRFRMMLVFGYRLTPRIPIFAVGYTGWSTMETLRHHLELSSHTDGALVINPGLYASKFGTEAWGPLALWGLISDLHTITSALLSGVPDPAAYAI